MMRVSWREPTNEAAERGPDGRRPADRRAGVGGGLSPAAQRTAADLAPAFDAGGVTWGVYQPLEAALDDPRLYKDNPAFQTIRHPSGLSYPAPGAMATIPQDARGPVQPAPRLGQHTDQVLADVLGMSGTEIGRLHDTGVVAGAHGQ